MDLDKVWLYRQGNWTEVDDPAAKFSEAIDNLFEMLHYNQTPRTYGVPSEYYVSICLSRLPLLGRVRGSYLQLVPRLVDYMHKALQLILIIQGEFPGLDA